ncbi:MULTISPECIES: hypothetical protein [unclassified Dysgonomonas]|uniref:hypothetical protein n=1 Tax=unclassified Dysgonomonas TaxID=2630389 RepID=UPI0025BFCC54|nr:MULTISPECIES: hypothetical protein [unclassified Dysgonomonas]HMM02728.1 hypothetical protein [Dysgonomonas sp.]
MTKLNSLKLARINRLILASLEYATAHSSECKFRSLDTSLLLVSDRSGECYPKLSIPVKVDPVSKDSQVYPDDLVLIKEAFKATTVQVCYWPGQSPYVNFYFD